MYMMPLFIPLPTAFSPLCIFDSSVALHIAHWAERSVAANTEKRTINKKE